jgi:hypothetical protein
MKPEAGILVRVTVRVSSRAPPLWGRRETQTPSVRKGQRVGGLRRTVRPVTYLFRRVDRPTYPAHIDRTARRTALLSGLTLAIGVAVFAFRTAHTVMGDGEVSAVGVLASGLMLLVVPIAAVAFWMMRRSQAMLMSVGAISVVAGVTVALMRPGNLYIVGFVGVLLITVTVLLAADGIRVLLDRRRLRHSA